MYCTRRSWFSKFENRYDFICGRIYLKAITIKATQNIFRINFLFYGFLIFSIVTEAQTVYNLTWITPRTRFERKLWSCFTNFDQYSESYRIVHSTVLYTVCGLWKTECHGMPTLPNFTIFSFVQHLILYSLHCNNCNAICCCILKGLSRKKSGWDYLFR
jgi:hypothetical protein